MTLKTPKKTNKKKFFHLLLFEGTLTSFFKEKKSKKSRKTVGIKVFLTIFALWDPGGPKTYGFDGSESATRPIGLKSVMNPHAIYPEMNINQASFS